jgi:uncharacterized protein YecT (DUF1311 family)
MMSLRAASLAVLAALFALPAAAQDSCPGAKNNDECDRMRFEALDRELIQAVEARLAEIGRRSTFTDKVEAARASFVSAQRHWVAFRAAECESQASVSALISARTIDGLTAVCLAKVTKARIDEIRKF